MRIGERRRPDPRGRPGYLRVDTVHAWTSSTFGDRNGVRGIYDINLVDHPRGRAPRRRPHRLRSAVTQFEHVGAVPGIAESFLVPLQEILAALPFVVFGFHADNASHRDAPGSEYANHTVAAMLNKMHVPNFTRSRARHPNDNALVEGKNASVVRKWLGHDHIPQRFAPEVNADRLRSTFARDVLSPYLNHHHPCLFATEVRNAKGKVRRRYRRRASTRRRPPPTTCRPDRRAGVAIALDTPPTPVAGANPIRSPASRQPRCPRSPSRGRPAFSIGSVPPG